MTFFRKSCQGLMTIVKINYCLEVCTEQERELCYNVGLSKLQSKKIALDNAHKFQVNRGVKNV